MQDCYTHLTAAIIWCDIPDQCVDVTANGKKQGTTAKRWMMCNLGKHFPLHDIDNQILSHL